MNLKLLALAGIMTATMGLTACDSNKENAAEDLSDAQEEVQDASEQLDEAAAEGEAVPADAEAAGLVSRKWLDTLRFSSASLGGISPG